MHDAANTIPDGWYMALPGSSLRAAAPARVRMLGTELTVERSAAGSAVARDAAGRPRLAREVNDMVVVWHGDAEPTFDVAPCPELESGRWTSVLWGASRVYATAVQNVQRDVVDNAHFEPVHHLSGAETRVDPRGPYLDTTSQGIMNMRRLGGPPMLAHIRLDGRLHGLGLLTYRTTITLGVQIRSLVLSAPTPIDDRHVRMQLGIATPRLPVPGAAAVLRKAIHLSVLADYERDAVHWESARARFAGGVVDDEASRLLGTFDRWLEQFAGRSGGAVASA